jgi:transposase
MCRRRSPALGPILEQLKQINAQIRAYDREVERLAERDYPETARMTQVTGVGALTALTFALVIEDPTRFRKSRTVGAYLGLRPRRSDSGDRASAAHHQGGQSLLRRLLVQSAAYILGPHGPDCDLRRFGERIAARGGKSARKRARVAVARKLAVLLHRLWVSGEATSRFRQANGRWPRRHRTREAGGG